MSKVIEDFLAFVATCQQRNARCRMHIPKETSYEEMVRKYEAGDAGIKQTMKSVVSTFGRQSAEEELENWKRYARDERAALREQVALQFELAPHASAADMQTLEAALKGASPGMLAFYRKHEGGALFVNSEPSAEVHNGIHFLPIANMARERDDTRVWLENDPEPSAEEIVDGRLEVLGLPDWYDDCVVFGAFAYAAERFLVATSGPHRGCVFEFDHDPLGFIKRADSFEDFLIWMMEEPARTAELTGLYTIEAFELDD
jgi:hypothetical protein